MSSLYILLPILKDCIEQIKCLLKNTTVETLDKFCEKFNYNKFSDFLSLNILEEEIYETFARIIVIHYEQIRGSKEIKTFMMDGSDVVVKSIKNIFDQLDTNTKENINFCSTTKQLEQLIWKNLLSFYEFSIIVECRDYFYNLPDKILSTINDHFIDYLIVLLSLDKVNMVQEILKIYYLNRYYFAVHSFSNVVTELSKDKDQCRYYTNGKFIPNNITCSNFSNDMSFSSPHIMDQLIEKNLNNYLNDKEYKEHQDIKKNNEFKMEEIEIFI